VNNDKTTSRTDAATDSIRLGLHLGQEADQWHQHDFPALIVQSTNIQLGRFAAKSVRDYFKGRTILAVIQGAAIGVAVAIMGVPLALSIAIVNIVGAYVPYIGAFVGGAFAFVLALSEGGMPLAIGVLAVVLAVNLGLENLLEPRLVGTSLNMHPSVVLLATLAGGLIAGIVGLILAAPAVAISYNLYKELQSAGFFDVEQPRDTS